MPDLTPEERARIYEEEKARMEVRRSVQGNGRPLAGIAVAGVIGVVSLVWSFITISGALSGTGIQSQFFAAFPGTQGVSLLANSVGMIGYAAVICGAFMAFFMEPNGARIIRLASWGMIAASIISAGFTVALVRYAPAWFSLAPAVQGGFFGGIIVGLIGTVLTWWLVLFLFRSKKKSPGPQ